MKTLISDQRILFLLTSICFLTVCSGSFSDTQPNRKLTSIMKRKFIVSVAGTPVEISFGGSPNIVDEKVLLSDDISDVRSLSVDGDRKTLIFTAKGRYDDFRSIFKLNLASKSIIAEKIFHSGSPVISPDGNKILINKGQEVFLYDLNSKNNEKIELDPKAKGPFVWVSYNSFFYCTNDNRLLHYKMEGKVNISIGEGMIPRSYCRETNSILCGDYYGRKIFLIDLNTYQSIELRSSKSLSMSDVPIFSCGGEGYLFSRQTWSNQLQLNDGRDLFYSDMDGNEIHLLKNKAISGGFCMPDDIEIPRFIKLSVD